jgi:hypothetical protein
MDEKTSVNLKGDINMGWIIGIAAAVVVIIVIAVIVVKNKNR